jgi:hypothetical protein
MQSIARPRFEKGTSQIQVKGVPVEINYNRLNMIPLDKNWERGYIKEVIKTKLN